jgi:hypothetical protein
MHVPPAALRLGANLGLTCLHLTADLHTRLECYKRVDALIILVAPMLPTWLILQRPTMPMSFGLLWCCYLRIPSARWMLGWRLMKVDYTGGSTASGVTVVWWLLTLVMWVASSG